jgi:hypothetical protein
MPGKAPRRKEANYWMDEGSEVDASNGWAAISLDLRLHQSVIWQLAPMEI